MSYRAAAALQSAIFGRLAGFPALAGVAIVDAIPPGTAPASFILIGPETVTDQADKTSAGAEHRLEISVISDASGFLTAKAIAGSVSAALEGAALTLTLGRVVSISFVRAVARRLDEGASRRIDMVFRARIEI